MSSDSTLTIYVLSLENIAYSIEKEWTEDIRFSKYKRRTHILENRDVEDKLETKIS